MTSAVGGDEDLLPILVALETRLLEPEVRADEAQLSALLHAEFEEIGASGRRFTRKGIIEALMAEPPLAEIRVSDFELQCIEKGVALLTYVSQRLQGNGEASVRVRRASLWQHTDQGWQVRFHQGTPSPTG